MITRYSRPEMRAIWTDENKLRLWLQIELLASEALAAGESCARRPTSPKSKPAPTNGSPTCPASSPASVNWKKSLNHDVIGFTTAVAEKINDNASRWFHFGLTSATSATPPSPFRWSAERGHPHRRREEFAAHYRMSGKEFQITPCIGRSHGIHGEPTTFGLKLALMHDEFGRALRPPRTRPRGRRRRQTFRCRRHQRSSLAATLRLYVCKQLGLQPAPIATQVVQRDIHAEFQLTLALVGASIERWAVEFRHLQRTEVLEAEEPFTKGQKGSSAMPHKRNPITWERLTGLARVLRGNAIAALENVALWHERDISHSSVERIIFPDSCTLLDYMFGLLTRLMDGLEVYPENMKKNLGLSLGMWNSQTVLLALIKKGLTREAAYKLVQDAAMKTWEVKHAGRDDADFVEQLKSDPGVAKHFKTGELEKLCSLDFHLKEVKNRFKKLGL